MSTITTENQIEYLEDFISNLDELLMAGEVNDLLIAIDDAIIETFDEDGYPDETGNQLQRIYDEIYSTNEDGKIVYLDDSVDIGKEPPEVPEELKELHEQIRKKFMRITKMVNIELSKHLHSGAFFIPREAL